MSIRYVAIVLVALVSACGGGPYGYTKIYSPTGAEESAVELATEYDPVMAGRRPAEWRGKKIWFFGVVEARKGKGEDVDLTLGMRQLQSRNLCETDAADTCRVTISEHVFATVHGQAKLTGADMAGEHSVGPGSLLRVVGTLKDNPHSKDRLPVVEVEFYRHWPRNYFVTTSARSFMRR